MPAAKYSELHPTMAALFADLDQRLTVLESKPVYQPGPVVDLKPLDARVKAIESKLSAVDQALDKK